MLHTWRVVALMSILVTLSGAIGCGGGSGPAPVSVSGTITLNGEPLEGAKVTFVSENFSSFGTTGPEGRYTLAQGAVPGKNVVSISKWEGEEMEFAPEEGFDEGQLEAAMEPLAGDEAAQADVARQLIPSEYQNMDYIVPEGGIETANFQLTSH